MQKIYTKNEDTFMLLYYTDLKEELEEYEIQLNQLLRKFI